LTILISSNCRKKDHVDDLKPNAEDSRAVLLKDIEMQGLPSPYFHFEYDALHYITNISFGSDFLKYHVEYENKRVKSLTNTITNTSLHYSYKKGQVSNIDEFSGSTGRLVISYRLDYNENNQLTQVLWYQYSVNGEVFPYKKAELSYHTDGNLKSVNWYTTSSSGPLIWSSKTEFTNYDNNTNVDDLILLKTFYYFDDYLFLPHVRLQKNNPLKEYITTPTTEYDVSYTYKYQNGLPAARTAVTTTKGGNGQGPIQYTDRYSYY
jgi:hypothetical protein